MAFKFDFAALNAKTPEQRQADELARYERLKEQRVILVDERKIKLENLVAYLEFHIPEKDVCFIRDMEYKASVYDLDSLQGGELADMTDNQVKYLDGLHHRYVEHYLATASKSYIGEIVLVSEAHKIIQHIGRGVHILHVGEHLDRHLSLGEKVTITYDSQVKGVVIPRENARSADLER